MSAQTTEVRGEGGGPSEILLHSNHPRIAQILEIIKAISESNSTVLIQGESGTGKDLFARLIHQRSPRCDGPWVPVDCGAIPHDLMESELFGHVKGAFTGAHEEKEGLFKAATEGTLFLDEIGELPLTLQSKLLRALQTAQVRAVGSTRPTNVDIRVIAASNRDLKSEVRQGRFRLDLYYRLNVIGLDLPALRERQEDIPDLLEVITARLSQRGIPSARFSAGALDLLTHASWPGNIRELENVVERLLIFNMNGVVSRSEVSKMLLDLDLNGENTRSSGQASETVAYSPEMTLREVEETHILRVLEFHEGNKTRAAQSLAINVKTLYNKLKVYSR